MGEGGAVVAVRMQWDLPEAAFSIQLRVDLVPPQCFDDVMDNGQRVLVPDCLRIQAAIIDY